MFRGIQLQTDILNAPHKLGYGSIPVPLSTSSRHPVPWTINQVNQSITTMLTWINAHRSHIIHVNLMVHIYAYKRTYLSHDMPQPKITIFQAPIIIQIFIRLLATNPKQLNPLNQATHFSVWLAQQLITYNFIFTKFPKLHHITLSFTFI